MEKKLSKLNPSIWDEGTAQTLTGHWNPKVQATVEIEVDGRRKYLQDIYGEVKKICEDHNGNYELRIKVTNVIASDLVKTDISKTIQDTTKKYLENLAERGVLTESSQATSDSIQRTP